VKGGLHYNFPRGSACVGFRGEKVPGIIGVAASGSKQRQLRFPTSTAQAASGSSEARTNPQARDQTVLKAYTPLAPHLIRTPQIISRLLRNRCPVRSFAASDNSPPTISCPVVVDAAHSRRPIPPGRSTHWSCVSEAPTTTTWVLLPVLHAHNYILLSRGRNTSLRSARNLFLC
jgi:hypothetical protein